MGHIVELLTITNVLTALTCWISYQAFNDRSMKGKMLFLPKSINERNEFYRFFSSGFIHANWLHLGFNMIALYSFGNNVELVFKLMFGMMPGSILYIALYFMGMVAASLPDYAKHKNHSGYRALGASGAVSAVVFVNILFEPWRLMMFPPLPQIIVGIGFLFYSSYMAKNEVQDGIGHSAHYYGALFGILFISLFQPLVFTNFLECTFTYNKECLNDLFMKLFSK